MRPYVHRDPDVDADAEAMLTVYTDGSYNAATGKAAGVAVLFDVAGQGGGAARPVVGAATLGGVARPDNFLAEAMAVAVAVAAPRDWRPKRVCVNVATDAKAVVDAWAAYSTTRSAQKRNRNAMRAFCAIISRAQHVHGVRVVLRHVHAHQQPGASEAGDRNNIADVEAKRAVRRLDHDNPTCSLDTRTADGPLTVVTTADHPLGPNLHVAGDVRAWLRREMGLAAETRLQHSPQGEVLRHAGAAALRQATKAVGPQASAAEQLFVLRAGSATLPTFQRLLTNFDGVTALESVHDQAWLRLRQADPRWRITRAMRTDAVTGALLPVCVLCEQDVPETAEHTFLKCDGEWAAGKAAWWCHRVREELEHLELGGDAHLAAAALWARLATGADAHWADAIGFFKVGDVNATLDGVRFDRLKKNREKRGLRAAMVEYGNMMWRRRSAALFGIINRNQGGAYRGASK